MSQSTHVALMALRLSYGTQHCRKVKGRLLDWQWAGFIPASAPTVTSEPEQNWIGKMDSKVFTERQRPFCVWWCLKISGRSDGWARVWIINYNRTINALSSQVFHISKMWKTIGAACSKKRGRENKQKCALFSCLSREMTGCEILKTTGEVNEARLKRESSDTYETNASLKTANKAQTVTRERERKEQ